MSRNLSTRPFRRAAGVMVAGNPRDPLDIDHSAPKLAANRSPGGGKYAMSKDTVLKIFCAWCRADMGEKDGQGTEGETSSMCRQCWAEYFPGVAYPRDEPSYTCPACGMTSYSSEDIRNEYCGNCHKTRPMIEVEAKTAPPTGDRGV